jgi:hypothetical protein
VSQGRAGSAATVLFNLPDWSNWFPLMGLHTIKVVVVGTAGHPRVDVDGFFTGPCIYC